MRYFMFKLRVKLAWYMFLTYKWPLALFTAQVLLLWPNLYYAGYHTLNHSYVMLAISFAGIVGNVAGIHMAIKYFLATRAYVRAVKAEIAARVAAEMKLIEIRRNGKD